MMWYEYNLSTHAQSPPQQFLSAVGKCAKLKAAFVAKMGQRGHSICQLFGITVM